MSMPLGEPSFWILSSLAGGRKHGYGILQDVSALTSGATALKVPTLYTTLDRLEHQSLIVADGEEVVDGRARRYYAITDAGTAALDEEAARLARRAAIARDRLAAQPRTAPARPATARTAIA